MIKHSVRYFNGKEVRAVWDQENSKWWYSATDFISILVNPHSPRRYWYNVKNRNSELSPFCGQLKLWASDNKKYLSDVVDENGVRLLLTIIPSKYKKQIQNWLNGMLDPIDEQSKKKAYELYKTSLVLDDEIGKTISLQKIHGYLFEGLYPFAGKIRIKNISKGGFMFANADYLEETLNKIDSMPETNENQIIEKYVEMNIAHPFMEGNGRATRIWLDYIFIKRLGKCVDWSLIEKEDYLAAMKESVVSDRKIKELIHQALKDETGDRELFLKGIDYSYYYEEE